MDAVFPDSATGVELQAEGHPPPTRVPLVIAHRGASGYLPEHTLPAYRLAIRMGADYVEPDLVSTADGVLVARHENEISATTDVASRREFAGRRTTKVVSGREVTGWFTEDFTLAELKTLRAVERLPRLRPGSARYDGRFPVPTFDEVLDLVAEESGRRGQVVGVYPETKHSSYFSAAGLSLERALARALRAHDLDRPNAQVFVQSFEVTNLRLLRTLVRVPLVQLVGRSGTPYDQRASDTPRRYDDLLTPAGLREVSTYAAAIGTDRRRVVPVDAAGALCRPTGLVEQAHRAGLLVHVYTFRDENRFLPAGLRRGGPRRKGDAVSEYLACYDAGVDGVFSDHADTALRARARWLARGRVVTAQSSSGMRTQPIT